MEKAFSYVKPRLKLFFYWIESGTRVRFFLTILGYILIAIITARCNITYSQAVNIILGIREVVYANGSHAHVEYTKE